MRTTVHTRPLITLCIDEEWQRVARKKGVKLKYGLLSSKVHALEGEIQCARQPENSEIADNCLRVTRGREYTLKQAPFTST